MKHEHREDIRNVKAVTSKLQYPLTMEQGKDVHLRETPVQNMVAAAASDTASASVLD